MTMPLYRLGFIADSSAAMAARKRLIAKLLCLDDDRWPRRLYHAIIFLKYFLAPPRYVTPI